MIILRDTVTGNDIKFETTIFPDGTSQVWKISENLSQRNLQIIWMFENEGELFHLLQLVDLVKSELYQTNKIEKIPEIVIPYCPYARQDKLQSNNSTWAKHMFSQLLFQWIFDWERTPRITTYDIHSFNADSERTFWSTTAREFHNAVVDHDIIVFPDRGAADRYDHFPKHKVMYCEKVRNQQTGEIEGLTVVNKVDLTGLKVAIVDDICDGGRTFIEVAKAVKDCHPKQIDLVVSHGIFSKGLEPLYDAGIYKIITTNSLLKNKPQKTAKFEVHEIVKINYPVLDKSTERYIRKML